MSDADGVYLPPGEGRTIANGPNTVTFKATGEHTHDHLSVFEYTWSVGALSHHHTATTLASSHSMSWRVN